MDFNNKRFDFSKTENLLKLSAFILACISAFTTKEGFELLWKEKNFIAEIISWGFAVAVSIALVYCSLELSNAFKQGKQIGLIIVFLLFALLSVFFNFNSIYGRFTSNDKIADEARNIRNKIVSIRDKSITSLDAAFKYTYWKDSAEIIIKSLPIEENHLLRPGKGVLYSKIKDKEPKITQNFKTAESKFKRFRNTIDSIAKLSLEKVSVDKYIKYKKEDAIIKEESLEENLEKALEGYNLICTITKAQTSSFICSQEKIEGISGEPDYAFNSLVRFIESDKDLSKKEKSSIILSLFVSFLLDFPVFIALVLLNLRGFKQDEDTQDDNQPTGIKWD